MRTRRARKMSNKNDFSRLGDLPGELKTAVLMGSAYEETSNECIIWADLKQYLLDKKKKYPLYDAEFEKAKGTVEFNGDSITYVVGGTMITQYFEADGELGTTLHAFDIRNEHRHEELDIILNKMESDQFAGDIDEEIAAIDEGVQNLRHQAFLRGVQEVGLDIRDDVMKVMASLTGTKIDKASTTRRFMRE